MTGSGYDIRPITDYAGMKRAVEFQRLIWGPSFGELVPAAVFWFSNRIGGLLAGAFDPQGDMLGLIFGLTGRAGAEPVHWSDMLAVHPAARGRGIGVALKRYQREQLLAQSVRIVNWTFDPLESRNAHINFGRLGVTSHEYIRDCYGASSSPLHRGIGTDRLVAHWVLDSDRVRNRIDAAGGARAEHAAAAPGAAPVVNPAGEDPVLGLDAPRLLVRIPADIQGVKERDEVAARRWREHTRAAFETYFGQGYRAVELVRVDRATSAYVLERTGRPG